MTFGVRMMLLAGVCFAVMNVLVKYLTSIPAVEVVFFRALISLVISYVFIKRARISPWGNNKTILVLRGIFGTSALVLFFYTLQEMRLGTAMILHYLAPIFTSLLAHFFLKERLKWVQLIFFVVSFSGILMLKEFDADISFWLMVAGVGAALLSGAAYSCIRKLKFSENSHVIIFYFPLVATPATGLITVFVVGWVWPVGIDWLLLLGIGVLTQVAQYFLTKAYQSESANKVAAVSNVGIIYALLFGFFLFGEIFSIPVFTGMLLVMLGVVLNVLYRPKKQTRPVH
jgi:drug/metabolite transporter (DMT)-like permease